MGPWQAWVMESADTGLFGPGSVSWKLHAEPILFVAGLRSLYLQALHPRAMAGVAQNSNYRRDAWGRLIRTANYVGTTLYGTTAEAEEAGLRLRRRHARMTAVDPDTGERFRIDEPDLLRWVHVTEVESFLDTGRRAGVPWTTPRWTPTTPSSAGWPPWWGSIRRPYPAPPPRWPSTTGRSVRNCG